MSFKQKVQELEDPRRKSGRYTYKLCDLVLMALTATLCGEGTAKDIEEWCEEELTWLNEYLGASYQRAPSHDTFNRVFGLIKKEAFAELLQEMILGINGFVEGHIALDGKTTRGSGREGAHAIHTMNAYAVESGLAIAAYDCGGRGHEIKGIKQILTAIEVQDNLISIDSAGCQKAICQQIIEQHGDYLIAVKGNQNDLFQAIQDEFKLTPEKAKIILGEVEKRGQVVQQSRYCFLEATLPVDIKDKWMGLQTIIKEEKVIDGGVKFVRYFISSSIDINYLAKSTRGHWAIENGLHWHLDVYLREDASKCYKNNSAQNWGMLRKIALNTLKITKDPKKRLKSTRRRIEKSIEFREQTLEAIGFQKAPLETNINPSF